MIVQPPVLLPANTNAVSKLSYQNSNHFSKRSLAFSSYLVLLKNHIDLLTSWTIGPFPISFFRRTFFIDRALRISFEIFISILKLNLFREIYFRLLYLLKQVQKYCDDRNQKSLLELDLEPEDITPLDSLFF